MFTVLKNHNVLWYVLDSFGKIVYVTWYEHIAESKAKFWNGIK